MNNLIVIPEELRASYEEYMSTSYKSKLKISQELQITYPTFCKALTGSRVTYTTYLRMKTYIADKVGAESVNVPPKRQQEEPAPVSAVKQRTPQDSFNSIFNAEAKRVGLDLNADGGGFETGKPAKQRTDEDNWGKDHSRWGDDE